MNLSNKENKVKEILSDIQFDLNTEEIWNAVEADLPKKKRRIIPFWFFGSGLILLGIFGFLLNQIAINKNTKTLLTETKISKKELASSSVKKDVSDKTNKDMEIKKSNFSNLQITSNPNSLLESKRQNRISNTPILNKNHGTVNNKSGSLNSAKQVSNSNHISNSEFTKTNSTSILIPLLILSFESIENLDPPVLSSSRNQPVFNLTPQITPLVPNQLWRTTLVLRNGINRNISSNVLSPSAGEFVESEFSKETDLYGYNSEIYIDAFNRSGWTIGTGVSYGKSTSRYSNQDQSVSTTHNNLLQETQVRDNDITWHRVHRTVDLRMVIRKELFQLNKFKISPEVGLGYNLWSDHQGYYFSKTSFPFTPFTSQEESPYVAKTGIDGQLGLMFSTKIANWEIGVLPYFRYNPNNIINNNHFYNLKNSQAGLHISVAYKPNWERFKKSN